jgi:hypothetical protein
MAQAANPEMTQDIGAPAPPRVDVVTIPAGSLGLGMTVRRHSHHGKSGEGQNPCCRETEMTRLDFPAKNGLTAWTRSGFS